MTLFKHSRFLCCSVPSFGVTAASPKYSSLLSMSPTSAIIFIKCRNRQHMKNNINYKGNINSTSVIIFLIRRQKLPKMVLCLGEPPRRFLVMSNLVSFLYLHFIFWSSFCCCSSFADVLHSHLLFDITPHPSVDYRRVFTPILYFQPSPSQSDLRHFHFQPFRYLSTANATVLSGHFLPTGVFYLTLLTNILPAFIKASLGAGSSSLNFAGLHTDPRNTDPAHLFVWFTVIDNLHIQNDSVLNSTIYYHELLLVKV